MMKTLLKHLLPVVTATFTCGWVANGQEQGTKPAAAQIPIIQMQDVPLSVAIENLAIQAEINSTIDPKITDKVSTPVTFRWENMTAKAALVRLLKERGFFAVENPQTGVSKITATDSPPRVFEKEFLESSKDVIPLVQMTDVPLATALANLGRKAGLQFQLDPTVSRSSKPSDSQFSFGSDSPTSPPVRPWRRSATSTTCRSPSLTKSGCGRFHRVNSYQRRDPVLAVEAEVSEGCEAANLFFQAEE